MRILLGVWIWGAVCGLGQAAGGASKEGGGDACRSVPWRDGRYDRWAWLYLEFERQVDEAAWKGVACPERLKAAADASAQSQAWRKQAAERIERFLAAKDVTLMLEIEARDIAIAKIAMGPEKAALLREKREGAVRYLAEINRGEISPQTMQWAQKHREKKDYQFLAQALWEAEKSGLRDLSRGDKRTMKYAAGGAVVGAAVGAGIGVAAGVEGSAALVAGVKGTATTVFRGGMQMARGFMRSSTARQTAQLKNVVERSEQASSLKDLAQKRDLASAGSLGLSLMKPSARLIPAWIKKPVLDFAGKVPALKKSANAMTQAAAALARKSKQSGLAGRMLWKVGINQAAAGAAGALVSASEGE